jgi:hypothetical protein
VRREYQRRRYGILWLLSALFVSGCASGGPSYLPLTEGREWSYSVNSGFQNDVVTLKVGPKINVGEYNGVSLIGPVGESRVAWAGSKLIASQFANARFNPPLPILDEAKIPPKKSSGEDEGKLRVSENNVRLPRSCVNDDPTSKC